MINDFKISCVTPLAGWGWTRRPTIFEQGGQPWVCPLPLAVVVFGRIPLVSRSVERLVRRAAVRCPACPASPAMCLITEFSIFSAVTWYDWIVLLATLFRPVAFGVFCRIPLAWLSVKGFVRKASVRCPASLRKLCALAAYSDSDSRCSVVTVLCGVIQGFLSVS